jgi:deaminated glutathione amidase
MKIAAIQMNSGDSVAVNLRAAEALLEEAVAGGAMLAVLPENFAFIGAKDVDKLGHAEADGQGPIQDWLRLTAARLSLWIVGGTIPLAVPGNPARCFAASLLIDAAGERVARYDKMHLFDVEVPKEGGGERYRESATIEPGVARFVVAETPLGKLGLTVCYDLRFPELYRRLSRQGAELIAVPSAFTQRTGEAHWETLLRARAIENQCVIIAPDQHGTHPGGRQTYGHSLIVDPWGQVLARRAVGAGVALAVVNREHLFSLRRTFPVLLHRRIDA